MSGPNSFNTPTDFLATACSSASDKLPAPGISRSITYWGMATSPNSDGSRFFTRKCIPPCQFKMPPMGLDAPFCFGTEIHTWAPNKGFQESLVCLKQSDISQPSAGSVVCFRPTHFASKREPQRELQLSCVEHRPRQAEVSIRQGWDEQTCADRSEGHAPARNRDTPVRARHGTRLCLDCLTDSILVVAWNGRSRAAEYRRAVD